MVNDNVESSTKTAIVTDNMFKIVFFTLQIYKKCELQLLNKS